MMRKWIFAVRRHEGWWTAEIRDMESAVKARAYCGAVGGVLHFVAATNRRMVDPGLTWRDLSVLGWVVEPPLTGRVDQTPPG